MSFKKMIAIRESALAIAAIIPLLLWLVSVIVDVFMYVLGLAFVDAHIMALWLLVAIAWFTILSLVYGILDILQR